jgi:hypothetical protein
MGGIRESSDVLEVELIDSCRAGSSGCSACLDNRRLVLTEVCLSLLCNTLLLLSTTTTMTTDAAQIKSEIARLTGKPSSPSIHYIHTH